MVDTFSAHYLYQKRDVFYFSRHVPIDLRDNYKTKRIVFSLKTKSKSMALRASRSISQQLEDYWMSLRLSKLDIPVQHLVKEQSGPNTKTQSPLLSEALETYLRLKGANKSDAFHRPAKRVIAELIELQNDRPIDEYSSFDAAQFRDHLLKRGLSTSSVKRNFSTIRAIINLTICEHGIDCRNAFSSIYIPDLDDVTKRRPIPVPTIRDIQKQCLNVNDDKRWLISIIADTGMRLSEAVGLHINDIILDHQIPYIDLKPHPWRPLKTKSSRRKIPLVGSALWAAKRIKHHNDGSPFAFPRYASAKSCNGNSASAALNKWLKSRVPDKCVIHSFRHSMRDRLRAVKCPTDMIDEIGGWVTSGVGEQYGEGHPLETKAEVMRLLISMQ